MQHFCPSHASFTPTHRCHKSEEHDEAFKSLFRQQTVVAAILRHDSETDELEVASLGVGTKFLASEGDCGDGARVADLHAESLCQAAFVRYLASTYRGAIAGGFQYLS